jgi:putative phage-type endonuclease
VTTFDAERRTGIGGSDAAAAIGISPWRTPYDLWCEKRGLAEPLPPSEPMVWGTLLEPLIASEYARRTGCVVERLPDLLRHPTWSFMIGHIDGRIVGESRILEVKTAHDARNWGEPGSDEVPSWYAAQCHHYLVVTGAQFVDVAVLVGGSDFRIYTIERDDEIAGMLIDQEAEFWRHHVETGRPPDPVNTADAVRRWGRLSTRGAVTAGVVELAAIHALHDIRTSRIDLDEAEQIAKLAIMTALGEHGDALVDSAGSLLATWQLDKGRKAYTVEAREPSRRFLLK